ncbi:hypothetical protein LTR64_006278 [Lithohypha guttulata]|uniref:uncharacterized protein n=1 Tax=Lithohypha guttulata TaxID=1690604 RepID=UPI00315CA52A
MSAAQLVNVHQALAIQLTNPQAPTIEGKLFRHALNEVEEEKKREGKLPAYFANLFHAQTIEEVRYALELERKSNDFWSKDVGKAWLKNLSRFAEQAWHYKVVLDSVVARMGPDFMAPIGGTMSFLLGIIKDLGTTAKMLESTERTLRQSMTRFERYFRENTMSQDVQSALVTYYKLVLNFAVDVHGEFAGGRLSMLDVNYVQYRLTFSEATLNAVHRTLKSKLADLQTDIHHAIDDVDKGATIDCLDNIRAGVSDLQANLANVLGVQPSTRGTNFGLPSASATFTGRRQYLSNIWAFMHNAKGQARMALWGMGGIGKTQMLQKYANDQLRTNTNPRGYDIIIYVNAHSKSSVFAAILSFMQVHARNELMQRKVTETDYSSFHVWMLSRENWLLVIDNVSNLDDVRNMVPEGNVGHVLFSTRYAHMARDLAPNTTPLEVTQMLPEESVRLVLRLADVSVNPADKEADIAHKVADFAGGMPLLIEQIVKNALFTGASLEDTLQQVTQKTGLLTQKNMSSLHQDNLSLAAAVMQTIESVKRRSVLAEALLKILTYLEPSSIPVTLLHDGAARYRAFLQQPVTYTRGTIKRISASDLRDRIDVDVEVDGLEARRERRRDKINLAGFRATSAFHKFCDKQKQASSALPVDDMQLRTSLLREAGPDTPLGRVFDNLVSISDAIVILRDAAVIRNTSATTLWMHDLVSEIAKTLISDESGPELSHLIASTKLAFARGYSLEGLGKMTEQEEHINRSLIIEYFRHAYMGYMAGWQRLRNDYGISNAQILRSMRDDRSRGIEWGFDGYNFDQYATEFRHQRFGRSAPWRALQTAIKLAILWEQNLATLPYAVGYTKAVLEMYKKAFGDADDDTIHLVEMLIDQVGDKGQDLAMAYDLGRRHLRDYLNGESTYFRTLDERMSDEMDEEFLYSRPAGCGLSIKLGWLCMELGKACDSAGDEQGRNKYAAEAIERRLLLLKWHRLRLDEYDHMCVPSGLDLARAYDLARDVEHSLHHYATAVHVSMYEEYLPVSKGIYKSYESTILKVMETYEEARSRLLPPSSHIEVSDDLKELLHRVDMESAAWKERYHFRQSQIPKRKPLPEIDWDALYAQPF